MTVRAAPSHSNQVVIRNLPAWLIVALTIHHELWHYLAARALALPARIEPGVTRYSAEYDWQRVIVLLAPAVVGLALIHWPLWAAWWWAGCIGDFMDVARLAGNVCGHTTCAQEASPQ